MASTPRALLYLPVKHSSDGSQNFAGFYKVPLLCQGNSHTLLANQSYINTERVFEIGYGEVRTFKVIRYCGSDQQPVIEKGFSLDIPSLRALAKFLIATPALRAHKDYWDGSDRVYLLIGSFRV
jgi:hypothetical protein